jgi:tRNA(Ile2) C34 agmatinyltransferase TiaS
MGKTDISKVKTLCCNAEWYKKGRADFRCKKCEKDVTMQMLFAYEAINS